MNWVTEHVVLRDIQQLAHRRLAEAGAPRFAGYLIDLPPKVVDVFLQATVAGFEYPRPRPAHGRSASSARSWRRRRPHFEPPGWWDELGRRAAGGPRDPGHARQRRPGRLLGPTMAALAGDDVLVVATTGGPGSGAAAERRSRPTCGWSGSSRTICCCPGSTSW